MEPVPKTPKPNENKRIECIHVDGGNYEGPGHIEVHFFWKKRHLEKRTIVQLITTCGAQARIQPHTLTVAHSNT